MIYYGICVGPGDDYERLTGPAVAAVVESPSAVLTRRDQTSIASAYNEMIAEALADPDAEALVLLHDDVVLRDRNFEARIRRRLTEPDVGVIGAVGGRGLRNMRYCDARDRFGRTWDAAGFQDFGPLRGDVDAVDGLLMVLSRTAMAAVRFDEVTTPDFHGYDADYCMMCRPADCRVVVEPFWLYHDSPGSGGATFDAAQERFMAKWREDLRSPSPAERSPRVRAVAARAQRLADAGRPLADEARRQARHAAAASHTQDVPDDDDVAAGRDDRRRPHAAALSPL